MVSQKEEVKKPETSVPQHRGRRSSGAPIFPRDPLLKALKIVEAIEQNNAGRPFDRITLAKAVNYSPNSSSFRQLITSSSRYGLTDGGVHAEKVALTTLGSSIVAPTNDGEKMRGLKDALLNPPLFKELLNFYNNKQIPRKELLKNNLKKEFGVLPEDVDSCYDVIFQNIEDLKIKEEIRGNHFLQLTKLTPSVEATPQQVPNFDQEGEQTEQFEQPPEEIEIPKTKPIPKVFISHSKNRTITQQLKDMLEFGDFEYVIAEEEETAAIPIPEKVFGLMRECNCAIINVSADEENKQDDNSFRINENVLIEIGGAFVHYDKRVILLVDKRVNLPSNLQGLYKCEYEGDELSFNIAMKLQKVLTEFKKSL